MTGERAAVSVGVVALGPARFALASEGRVAFAGEPGSFAEDAVLAYFGGDAGARAAVPVPTFADDMPVHAEPGLDDEQMEDAPVSGGAPTVREPRAPEAMGRGRVVPHTDRPVQPSAASGRQQPTRQSKSKRGKK